MCVVYRKSNGQTVIASGSFQEISISATRQQKAGSSIRKRFVGHVSNTTSQVAIVGAAIMPLSID